MIARIMWLEYLLLYVIGMTLILRVGLENVRILAPRLAVTLITILYGLFWGYIVDPISCLLETTRKVTVF